MLTSDGLSVNQFLHLWRDAMADAAPAERARLMVELGRATLREQGQVPTLLVAVVTGRDEPLTLIPLKEAPGVARPGLREQVAERLAALGATEVYVLQAVVAGRVTGPGTQLMACWGEGGKGQEVCAMLPLRVTADGVEEAELLLAPDPSATVFSRDLAGLLPTRH